MTSGKVGKINEDDRERSRSSCKYPTNKMQKYFEINLNLAFT